MRTHPLLALATLVVLISITTAATHFVDVGATTRAFSPRPTSPARRLARVSAAASAAGGENLATALATNPLPLGLSEVTPQLVPHLGGLGNAARVGARVWGALRACESGNNYRADTGNGYFGAYQFAASTWWAIGFSGLPSAAPPVVQDAAARLLLARAGWSAWPVCARGLGLT